MYRVQVIGHSSFSAHPINLFQAFSNMSSPEKRYHLPKASQIPADIGNSAKGDAVNQSGLSDTNSYKNGPGSTGEVLLQGCHSTSTNNLPQSPNDIYLQSLGEYVAERKGVLGEGWRVEFEFCNKRLKTFSVYIAPNGTRFESMSDVVEHLGLPANSHSLQSENAENGDVPMQNGSHLYQRRKESLGGTKTSNSRPGQGIPKGSSSLRASSSNVERVQTRQVNYNRGTNCSFLRSGYIEFLFTHILVLNFCKIVF